MNKPYTFKLGDRVSFGGLEGKVTKIGSTGVVCVRLKDQFHDEWFSADGKYDPAHTQPLLVLVESAPKPKRKVTHTVYLNLHRNGLCYVYRDKELANEMSHEPFECREITWEVEVDE